MKIIEKNNLSHSINPYSLLIHFELIVDSNLLYITEAFKAPLIQFILNSVLKNKTEDLN